MSKIPGVIRVTPGFRFGFLHKVVFIMNILFEKHCTAGDVKSVVEMTGRGADVLRNVAGFPAEVLDGKHRPCPNCGGKDRFRVVNSRAGDVFCNHGCFGRKRADVLAVVQTICGVTFSEAVRMVAEYVGMRPSIGNMPRVSSLSLKKYYTKNENETETEKRGKQYRDPGRGHVQRKPKAVKNVVRFTHYDYEDGEGMPHLRVTRWDCADGTKEIRPFHWNAESDAYKSGIGGRLRVPWNAVEVKEAEIVFFVEGEKCATALKEFLTPEVLAEMNPPMFSEEVTVTCVIGGVNGFKEELAVWFLDKTVYILPDNDEPGDRFSWEVKRKIEQAATKHGMSANATVFRWPTGTPEKWDIADALENVTPSVSEKLTYQPKGVTHEYA